MPIPASQFLEVGSSRGGEPVLPTLGSVVFTLSSSQESAGINAHLSYISMCVYFQFLFILCVYLSCVMARSTMSFLLEAPAQAVSLLSEINSVSHVLVYPGGAAPARANSVSSKVIQGATVGPGRPVFLHVMFTCI